MKLTDKMHGYGYDLIADANVNNALIYSDGNVYVGVQKIGNVFRIDVQQVYMGVFPMDKSVDNLIVPNEELENAITQIMDQLTNPHSKVEAPA